MIVYRHRRLDTNQVFYVGIGKSKYRANQKGNRRSDLWNKIVNKTDYIIEIVAEVESWELACELEELLIQEYGRINLGAGTLANLTDGGEGAVGRILTEDHKSKISKTLIGHKHSEETIKKISESKKGTISHLRKKVINIENNVEYTSLKECCDINNICYTTLSSKLNNKRVNNTPYRYAQ